MASVGQDRGWLRLDFRYRRVRCREYLNLPDTRDARFEANRIKRRLEAEIRAGTFNYADFFPNSPRAERFDVRPRRGPTLAEFARQWLDEQEPHLAASTRYWYRCLLTSYVFNEPLASLPISEISDADLNVLVKHLTERSARSGRPLSERSINAVIARLRSIFRVAHRLKLVPSDPTVYVVNLREKEPEVDPFDLNEARALLDAAQGWERAFLAVLLFAGLRPNEALALAWGDHIDWRHGLIRVRRNLTRFGFGPPKTRASVRDVPMMGPVRAALAEQRARSELRGELVFPDAAGEPFDLANFRHRNWPRIQRRAGVRRRTLRQCRHTFARLLLERGESPQWVARALGHSSVQMVFRVYGRWCAATNLESRALTILEAELSALHLPKATGMSGKVREGLGNESQPMVVYDGNGN